MFQICGLIYPIRWINKKKKKRKNPYNSRCLRLSFIKYFHIIFLYTLVRPDTNSETAPLDFDFISFIKIPPTYVIKFNSIHFIFPLWTGPLHKFLLTNFRPLMSSLLTSQGLVLATAMAVSAGTIILFDLFRHRIPIKNQLDSPPQLLKSCLSSGIKKKNGAFFLSHLFLGFFSFSSCC